MVQVPTSDGSMLPLRSVVGIIVNGGSVLVAGITLKRMICRVFGPKPGGVIVGFLRALGK